MADQDKLDGVYMGSAILQAGLSRAIRAKVGAVLVTKQGVVLTGYNGTARGQDNDCEIKEYMSRDAGGWLNPDEVAERWPLIEYDKMVESNRRYRLVTKYDVIHAELNCVLKAAREGVSCVDGTVYVTMSPCEHCAALLVQVGVSRVVYKDDYRDDAGITFLRRSGINVEQHKE